MRQQHAPLTLYGFLNTALGAGLTLGAFLAGIFAQRPGVTRVLSVGLTLSGLAAIAYARLTNERRRKLVFNKTCV